MAKPSKLSVATASSVRARRAYFDCRFGQLHVRTAFPTTGGFDEGTTLICLHQAQGSSRTFTRFLGEIAMDRSVYAPDLPGCGESDGSASQTPAVAAQAIIDFAADLRLRQIDVLGFDFGAAAAAELAAQRPELVRRLVMVAPPALPPAAPLKQEGFVLRIKSTPDESSLWIKTVLPRAQVLDVAEYAEDLFDVAPKTLAKQIGAFLKA